MFDQIDRTLKNARGHYRERILAISAYERGYPVTEIAKLYGKTRKTIYNWIHRYESGGIEALRDRPKPGRPLLIDHHDQFIAAELRCAVDHLPEEMGYDTSAWTAKLLRHHIQRFYGIALSVQTAWRVLHRLGYTRQRPGRIPTGGDEHARNAWRIALSIAEQNCPKDSLILFADEAGFNIDPTITARWAPRGQQPKLPTSGRKQHISVIGAISRDRKHSHFTLAQRVTSEVFCQFLTEVHRTFRGYRKIYLILDNVSFHRSQRVALLARTFIDPEVRLIFQPSYSPDLNPISVPQFRWSGTQRIKNRLRPAEAYCVAPPHAECGHFVNYNPKGIPTYNNNYRTSIPIEKINPI